MYPGSRYTEKHYISIEINIVHLKSYEIQSNRCACGGVLQFGIFKQFMPLGREIRQDLKTYKPFSISGSEDAQNKSGST